MAEALYPAEPPPSYESQFRNHQMDTGPLPSAPPHPAYQERLGRLKTRSSSEDQDPHKFSPQRRSSLRGTRATNQNTSKTLSSSEKVDLSKGSAKRHVHKRLPPPPPHHSKAPVRPQVKPRERRPVSSFPLGCNYPSHSVSDYQSFASTQDAGHEFEESFYRGNNVSTSMYDVSEASADQPMPMTQSSTFQPPLHEYDYIDDLHSSHALPLETSVEMEEGGRPIYVMQGREAVLNRQASAPLAVHVASEPTGHIYCVNNPNAPQLASSLRQYMVDPQLSMQQVVHAPQASVQQQQTVPHLPSLNPPSLMANSQMIPQATGHRPLPKPRSLAQPVNQLAIVPISSSYAAPSSLPLNIPSLPSPANAVFSPQQNSQHFPANQILAPIPSMHTYSYTQQSSTVMMGIPQSQSTPLFGAISPHSNSITGTEHPVQLVPQQLQQQSLQQTVVNGNASIAVAQRPVQLVPQQLQQQSLQQTLVNGNASIAVAEHPVQFVPQQLQQQSLQQTLVNGNASGDMPQQAVSMQSGNHTSQSLQSQNQNLILTHNLKPITGNENQILSREIAEVPMQVESVSSAIKSCQAPPKSPQKERRKPVPKPRMMKRPSESNDLEGIEEVQITSPIARESNVSDCQELTPRETELEASSAPVKPPRRHVRKPAPPPPPASTLSVAMSTPPRPTSDPTPFSSVSIGDPMYETIEIAGIEQLQSTTEVTSTIPAMVIADAQLAPVSPTGYNVHDIFFNGNIIFLMPLSDPLRLPVKTSSHSIKGRGAFKNDCKFEVVFLASAIGHEQAVKLIMLKSFSHMDHYLSVSSKGKVKMTKGAKEKCKFIIRPVMERPLLRYGVISLESAIHLGWFLALSPRGKPRKCTSSRTAFGADESRFAVRIENQIRDRHVIQLQSIVSSKYLCINLKGKLGETGNAGDLTTHLMFFDRGMGIVSLRSSKKPKFWLRVKEGRVQGNGKPDLASDFRLLEAPDGSVLFESIIVPDIFLCSPCDSNEGTRANKNFKMMLVTK